MTAPVGPATRTRANLKAPLDSGPPAPIEKPLDDFRLTAGGGAKRPADSTFLPQLDSVTAASQATILALQSSIAGLHGEIAILEVQNQAKANAVVQLIQQIESRKAEIERQRENKRTIGILGALFGAPMVTAVSLIKMYEDDGLLETLNTQLAQAKSEQANISAKMSQHMIVRQTLEKQLAKLEATAAGLGTTAIVETPQAKTKAFGPVAAQAAELRRYEKLEANLKQQVAILTEIRNSAASIGLELDGLLEKLSVQLEKAEQMVVASKKSLFELIKIITSKDPQAAAEKWLTKKVASLTDKLLDELGLSMKGFIRDLVAEAFPNQTNSPAATLLRQQLEKALIKKPSPELSGVD